MTKGHILITGGKPKPEDTKRPPKTNTRKSRPKTDRYIEIVSSSASPCSEGERPEAKSGAGGVSPENHKDSSASESAVEESCRENVKDHPRVDKEAKPSAITRLGDAANTFGAMGIEYGDTLRACESIDDVRAWLVSQQDSFNEKAARGFDWRVMPDDMRQKANAILNGVGATPACMIGNDGLMGAAFEKLRGHLFNLVSANPENEVAFITFIDGAGGTSMDRPVIDVRKSRQLANQVMRKLAPHWLGMIDLAFFWTIQHADGGLHLQRHEHVVAWGPDVVAKAKRAAENHKHKFQANVTDLPEIDVRPGLDNSEVNMARLTAYLLKAPAKGKNSFPKRDGRLAINHTETKDRYIQFSRMAQLRSVLDLEDMIFGGGDGSDIKSSLVKDMRKLAESQATGRSVIHPHLIPTWWEDFNRILGKDHWALPAILRQ